MKRKRASSRPSDLSNLKNLIAAGSIVFPGQSERVARLALETPESIAFGTVRSIAAQCSVAPTTVSRVARIAGFENFADFKNLFREHVKSMPLQKP